MATYHPHKLSDHFTLGEFLSPHDPQTTVVPLRVVQRLVLLCSQVLEPLRTAYGEPLRITSGWRSPGYNAAVKGAKTSLHLTGDAADIIAASLEEQLRLLALATQIPAVGGIGFYPGRGFVHVDQRPREAGLITHWQRDARGRYARLPGQVLIRLRELGAVHL